MKFRTQFDDHRNYYSVLGETEKILYDGRYNSDGVLEIVPVGKDNLRDMIQSHKDSCDIHILMRRYQNGELVGLDKVKGVYGDFTKAPKTYAEMLNTIELGKDLFLSLSVEERAKYGHDFGRFISSYGTDIFTDTMRTAGILPQLVPEVVPEKVVAGKDGAADV